MEKAFWSRRNAVGVTGMPRSRSWKKKETNIPYLMTWAAFLEAWARSELFL